MSHGVHAAVNGRTLGGRQAVHARMVAHVSAVGHHHGVVRVAGYEHRLRVEGRPEVAHLGGVRGVGRGAVHVRAG